MFRKLDLAERTISIAGSGTSLPSQANENTATFAEHGTLHSIKTPEKSVQFAWQLASKRVFGATKWKLFYLLHLAALLLRSVKCLTTTIIAVPQELKQKQHSKQNQQAKLTGRARPKRNKDCFYFASDQSLTI